MRLTISSIKRRATLLSCSYGKGQLVMLEHREGGNENESFVKRKGCL